MEFDAWCIRHHWNAVHTCRLSREYRTKKLSNCENHGDNPIKNDRRSYRHRPTAYQIMPVAAARGGIRIPCHASNRSKLHQTPFSWALRTTFL